ncbi:MAG: hypothetical protein Q9169_003836 [Polycauliona sp. 2 TL-2023]
MERGLRAAFPSAYELIQRNPVPRKPVASNADFDDDLAKPSTRLPPKPLPGRPKYRPFLLATSITILNVIALAVLIKYIKYMLPDTGWDDYGIELEGTSCDLIKKEDSSRWQAAFQINLRGSAELSFAEAKFVDLCFDLIVGQGGRLLLAAISYFVFMDALVRSMEKTAISYKLYASLVFSSTSLNATWRATKAAFSTKGWRAKFHLTWCALAMAYILAFPTLIESMTGYVSPSSPGFNLANGQFVTSDSDDLKSCFNVTGGLLFGYDKNDTRAIGPPVRIFDAASRSSRFNKYDIDNAPDGVDESSAFWAMVNYQSYSYEQPFYYDDENRNTTRDGEAQNYTSSAERSRRSRGFSSIVLYITLSLQLVWTLGMYCLWLDANLASKLVKAGRTIRGPFRAATDLTEAMKETLGDEYCAYGDKEIEKELTKTGNGLRYYCTQSGNDDQLLHVGMTAQPGTRIVLNRQKLYGAEEKERRRDGS